MATDADALVAAAGDAARAMQENKPVPASITSMLRAAAMQHDEETRHRMAEAAEIRAGQIGTIARELLRGTIFVLTGR